MSSNPSISEDEVYPRGGWSNERISDFFVHRFGGGVEQWTEAGLRPMRDNGTRREEWVRFWASVRARAAELLERDAVPGEDYVLSEVVHCKSEAEAGVPEAAEFCVDRYLARLVSVSVARVLIVLEVIAGSQVRRTFDLRADDHMYGPIPIGGRERHVAFLPHPNARRARSFSACLPPDEMHRLQAAIGCPPEN